MAGADRSSGIMSSFPRATIERPCNHLDMFRWIGIVLALGVSVAAAQDAITIPPGVTRAITWDEGHGAQKRENRVYLIAKSIEFFKKYLLGS